MRGCCRSGRAKNSRLLSCSLPAKKCAKCQGLDMKISAKTELDHLRKIGWRLWDPIGLAYPDGTWDEGAADEYDHYLLRAITLLRRNTIPSKVVTYLDRISSEAMGLGPITELGHLASERTVDAIVNYLRNPIKAIDRPISDTA